MRRFLLLSGLQILTLMLTYAPNVHADEQAPASKPAQAEPTAPDPALLTRAKERKAEGDRAMDKLRHADALTAYTESYALMPEPALLYNMGRALEALDRLPEALEKLEAFRKQAPKELLAKVPGLDERIANIKKKVSTLTVKVNVEGARILVRDLVMGLAPLEKPLALRAGKAEVLIEADGYFPYSASIDLPGGGGYVIDAALSSKATMGKLIVEAPRTGVSVLVDGQHAGQAPIETIVKPGTHKILGRHAEFLDYETSVVVGAGESRKVALVLVRPPPIYAKWWFWTSIGVVVAGGAIGGTVYALTTERDPDKGDIAPGQLSPAVFVSLPQIKF